MGVQWPRAYILGIPSAYRGVPLEDQLTELGIEFKRIEGVDARKWNSNEIERAYSRRASLLLLGREMSPGEIACAIGHQRLMEAFLATGEEWALMFEDDVEIRKDLRPVIGQLGRLGQGRYIVLLESRNEFGPEDQTCQRLFWNGGFLWERARLAHGAGAYLISREAAELAVARYRKRRVDSVADWPAGWARDVTYWQAEPLPAIHSNPVHRQSFLAEGRDQVVKTRPLQEPTNSELLAFRVWRYSGLQMLYGLFIGVPIRDSFFTGIAQPLRQRPATTAPPLSRAGARRRARAEESIFGFLTTKLAKTKGEYSLTSVRILAEMLRLLGRKEAAATYRRLFLSLKPEFDPLADHELPEINLLVVAAPKDFHCLPAVLNGAAANVRNPVSAASIVTTSQGMEAAREVADQMKCAFPLDVKCEDSFIDQESRNLVRETVGHRYGWLLQQFLNLAYSASCPAAGVLAIDADTVFLEPRAFLDSHGVQILTPTYGVHNPYYLLLEQLGVIPREPMMAFVPHFMLYQPDIVDTLLKTVAEGDMGSLIRRVLQVIDTTQSSPACVDFELYAQYLVGNQPERATLARWSNVDAREPLEPNQDISDLRRLYPGWGSVSFHGYIPALQTSAPF